MRIAISAAVAAAALGLMAAPVSAATAESAAPAFKSRTWNCEKPAGKKLRIENTSPTERWTRLTYTNRCDHGWLVTVSYRNPGGKQFSYNSKVAAHSKGNISLLPRPDRIVKVKAKKR